MVQDAPRGGRSWAAARARRAARGRAPGLAPCSGARGLAAYCRALAKPGREAIIAELAERGLSADWLTKLDEDAEAIERAGRNAMLSAQATVREAEAPAAQGQKWQEVRRMVRVAVKGIGVLAAKYADC